MLGLAQARDADLTQSASQQNIDGIDGRKNGPRTWRSARTGFEPPAQRVRELGRKLDIRNAKSLQGSFKQGRLMQLLNGVDDERRSKLAVQGVRGCDMAAPLPERHTPVGVPAPTRFNPAGIRSHTDGADRRPGEGGEAAAACAMR